MVCFQRSPLRITGMDDRPEGWQKRTPYLRLQTLHILYCLLALFATTQISQQCQSMSQAVKIRNVAAGRKCRQPVPFFFTLYLVTVGRQMINKWIIDKRCARPVVDLQHLPQGSRFLLPNTCPALLNAIS